MLIFQPSFVNCCPSNLLSGFFISFHFLEDDILLWCLYSSLAHGVIAAALSLHSQKKVWRITWSSPRTNNVNRVIKQSAVLCLERKACNLVWLYFRCLGSGWFSTSRGRKWTGWCWLRWPVQTVPCSGSRYRFDLATQAWFGLPRIGLATQGWFGYSALVGYSGLVWLLRFGLAIRVWFGYSGLVWTLRIGLATQLWFGYSGLVWLLGLGLAGQAWFCYSGLVWLLRFGLATHDWFGYSWLVWLLRLGWVWNR